MWNLHWFITLDCLFKLVPLSVPPQMSFQSVGILLSMHMGGYQLDYNKKNKIWITNTCDSTHYSNQLKTKTKQQIPLVTQLIPVFKQNFLTLLRYQHLFQKPEERAQSVTNFDTLHVPSLSQAITHPIQHCTWLKCTSAFQLHMRFEWHIVTHGWFVKALKRN